jgi:hypothetical protein
MQHVTTQSFSEKGNGTLRDIEGSTKIGSRVLGE